jgi:hypothetical protein
MQKHQWRQHGVVHFKARPLPGVGGTVEVATAVAASPTAAAGGGNNNDGSLFNPAPDSIQLQQEQAAEKPATCYVRPPSDIVVTAAAQTSPLPPVAHLLSAPVAVPVSRDNAGDHVARSLPAGEIVYLLPDSSAQRTIRQPMLQSALTLQKSTSFHSIPARSVAETSSDASERSTESVGVRSSPKPIKLRMKFAYQKEQEDNNTNNDSNINNDNGGNKVSTSHNFLFFVNDGATK